MATSEGITDPQSCFYRMDAVKSTYMYRSDKEGWASCRILCQLKKLLMGEDVFCSLCVHIKSIPADCQNIVTNLIDNGLVL